MGLSDPYRVVLDRLIALRIETQELVDDWDWNTEPTSTTFSEFNRLRIEAIRSIELARNKTSDAFVRAARAVVNHWGDHVEILARRAYDADDVRPAIDELMSQLAGAMPEAVRAELMPAVAPPNWLDAVRAELERAPNIALLIPKDAEESAQRAISAGVLTGHRFSGRLYVTLRTA